MEKKELIKVISKGVRSYENGVRGDSANFLAWFLINFFKLEEEEALSLICDSQNDKGIDGIYVDDLNEEVYLFQTKYSPTPGSDQGDNDLRNFVGAKSWFDTQENIELLDTSFASIELKSLVERVKAFDAIDRQYDLYQVFVTNKTFDYNANDFLQVAGDNFIAFDFDRMSTEYIYAGEDKSVQDTFSFKYDSDNMIQGQILERFDYYIFPVKVKEIVQLKGIEDKTLFARNVRYGLGRTRVNKEIRKTIADSSEHQNVVLYHNGLTLIAEKVARDDSHIHITNYSIVNGCQSTVAFYENQANLTNQLEVLLKVIKTGDDNRLADKITYYTNNQNAISMRDLKSNDKVQQDIQQQFFELFNNEILYKIKSGEDVHGYKTVVPNDFAAQLITAFYLKEPHNTHQKTRIFSNNYNEIFNRRIDASYIYLINLMYQAIEHNIGQIEHQGIRSYKTTRFFFLYLFRLILEKDDEGKNLISDSKNFLQNSDGKDLLSVFGKLFNVVVPDFNYYVNELVEEKGGFYDYKNDLRKANRVKEFGGRLLTEYLKSVNRHPEDAFSYLLEA